MKLDEVTGVSVNEVSSELLGRYKTAAGQEASRADKAGDVKTGNKRFSGIVKATKKQFANDAKSVKEDNDEDDFADEIYEALVDQYPNLMRRANEHAVGNAIMSVMQFQGQVSGAALVHDVAKAIKQSISSAEF